MRTLAIIFGATAALGLAVTAVAETPAHKSMHLAQGPGAGSSSGPSSGASGNQVGSMSSGSGQSSGASRSGQSSGASSETSGAKAGQNVGSSSSSSSSSSNERSGTHSRTSIKQRNGTGADVTINRRTRHSVTTYDDDGPSVTVVRKGFATNVKAPRHLPLCVPLTSAQSAASASRPRPRRSAARQDGRRLQPPARRKAASA
jgi:hypothetical protein